ncbi:MAG: hypothetical protein WCH58_00475 [Candidatus Saccharibacteria bacterium]
MQDLDFDELDKAVNSLVQYTTPKLTADNEPEDTILDLGTGDIILPDLTAHPVITPISNSAPSQTPLAGRRSNGRFMDVVPPSSNTRVNPTMPERVSRQGMTINPDDNLPMVPEVASAPAVIPEVKTNEWPDPIDFQSDSQNVADKTEQPTPEVNEDADIDQISNDITNTLNQPVDEPQDSPFLSGTKVEKRPLGAFSNEQSTVSVTQPVVQNEVRQPADLSSQAQPQAVISHMPAELHPDLLSIESGSGIVPNLPSMGDVSDTVTIAEVTPTPSVTIDPVVSTQPEGPTSITQQYSEQPNTGDQTTGAIYDTDSYHKAILKPTKKKSGLMLIAGILLLIIIGAGAGAAVYFYVLPR